MMQISVNGSLITEAEIARETQYHPASSLEEARQSAARALVIRELLVQQARRLGVSAEGVSDTDESRVSAVIERELNIPQADEATCRRYYEAQIRRFRSPDLIEARHILFPARLEDAAEVASARAKAANAIEVVQQRPDRFAELAGKLSACPSAKVGGSLGQLSRGSTIPELETFLFELEEGELCPVPVPSRYGFHVLRSDRRVDGRQLPFEAVQEKICHYLEERVWRQAVRQYIQLLIGAADIKGIKLQGSSSLLVQ
jgi:peptidyl-prolyl cis-trans isomerase C